MNTYGIRSLLEVLQINAHAYVEITRIQERYVRSPLLNEEILVPGTDDHRLFLEGLKFLHTQCTDTHLAVSAKVMENLTALVEKQSCAAQEVQKKLESWFTCFESELQTKVFCLILPHRVPYLPKAGGIGDSLLGTLVSFPDAQYDAWEAGSCFGCTRFSACIYHLMRVAEHGLVSVAAAANVPEEKISKGWDGCIQGIDSTTKIISSTKPADWQDNVKKYSDLSSWFTTIKSGWRNPSSHVPRIYSEQSASGMFSAVCTLFEHLNRYGFKQTKMPSDPLLPPGV
jgi:hypothetical protein